MNKVQLMYDVVKALREKQVLQGAFQVEGRKDGAAVFHLATEFEKNTATGECRSKIRTEYDYEGRRLKHESETELNLPEFQGPWPGRCGLMRHWHDHCSMMLHGHDHCSMMLRGHDHGGMMQHGYGHRHHGPFRMDGPEGMGPGCGHFGRHGGFKEGLDRLAFLLQVFQNTLLTEEEQCYVLSFRLADIPEELRRAFGERMNREELRGHWEHHPHCGILKELHGLEEPEAEVHVIVNKQKELQKVDWALRGVGRDESGAGHEWDIKAELSLDW
ncbi:hypothetical protein EDC14_1002162 [Hydrogenispora ethanolica]|uniref:Uncharacterized protein n=1 Tax=Hydrogenispora ethanolica TaxID=1082276 RepID=A0A4R1SA72_HYDET|nr:hypothetical protein [Hydrogenispora ethanolica]TCL76403.1 hypothetical protein EDC14_1002162 [Hydrogenispora ethanolica]